MKSRFLIFTLFLAVICIGGTGNAMAQSVTGTGVFPLAEGGGPPTTVTVSAQQGGNGGVMRLGQGQNEIIAHPVDICVQGNAALVVAQITKTSSDFPGAEGAFLQFGFVDNGGSGDLILVPFPFFISPVQVPACDLLNIAIPIATVERGGYHIKS